MFRWSGRSKIMSTENFEFADSQDSGYNGGISGARVYLKEFPSATPVDVIESVKAGLEAAGWSNVADLYSTLTVDFPYGLPSVPIPGDSPTAVEGGPSQVVLGLNGERFIMYDPYRTLPGSLSGDVWVAMGNTSDASLILLMSAIDGGSPFHVKSYEAFSTTYGGYRLFLESDSGGTGGESVGAGGSLTASGVPFWSATPAWSGGGYRLQAINEYGSWVKVGFYYSGSGIIFETEFSSGGEIAHARIFESPALKYSLIANQFQFILFREGATLSDHYNNIFVSLIYGQHGCQLGAFQLCIDQPGQFDWTTNLTVARDAEAYTNTFLAPVVEIYILKVYYGYEIKTSQKFTAITPAFIALAERRLDDSGTVKLCGKLWDCICMAKDAPIGNVMVHRDLLWKCIFRNAAFGTQPYSAWLAFDDAPTEV